MQTILPLACFFSLIRPPGIRFEQGLLQIVPVNKGKCPFVHDNIDVGFQLFTKHNPTVFQPLMLNDDEKLFASNIDFHAPTVFYFGAFLEQPDDGSGVMVREAYMLRGDTNVIMVDARILEAGPWYFTAAENTWYIGHYVAQFVDYLVSRGLNLTNTHFVGHSLGAQSAGVAGYALKSGHVSRITGLDPAFPLFDKLPLERRLDPTDAEFVDVIHTDAGIFGFNRPTGHVDFFPNGGISPQPGCELEIVLHQQFLTNKCDGRSHQPQGFYTFYLQPNHKDFHTRLYEFLTYIQIMKNNTETRPLHVNINKTQVTAHDSRNKNGKIDNVNVKDSILIATLKRKHDNVKIITEDKVSKEKKIATTGKPNKEKILLNAIKDHKTNQDAPIISNTGSETHNINRTTEHETKINTKTELDKEFQELENTTTDVNISLDKHHNGDKEKQEDTTTHKSTLKTKDIEQKLTSKDTDTKKRNKRFIPFFQKSETAENDNLLIKMLDFLFKHRKNVLPVISVMREINTLVKSGNGELNHVTKERNNYIGTSPVIPPIATYTLELGAQNKVVDFVKKLFGLNPKGDKLTIAGGK